MAEHSEQERMEQLVIEGARSSRANLLRRCGSPRAALDEVEPIIDKLLAALKGAKNDAAMQAVFMVAEDVATGGLEFVLVVRPN